MRNIGYTNGRNFHQRKIGCMIVEHTERFAFIRWEQSEAGVLLVFRNRQHKTVIVKFQNGFAFYEDNQLHLTAADFIKANKEHRFMNVSNIPKMFFDQLFNANVKAAIKADQINH